MGVDRGRDYDGVNGRVGQDAHQLSRRADARIPAAKQPKSLPVKVADPGQLDVWLLGENPDQVRPPVAETNHGNVRRGIVIAGEI